jgi:hypothetical protein
MPIRSGRQIRSGRFKGSATGPGIPIIAGKDGLFRIYNAGEAAADAFDIHPQQSGGVVHLPPECSIDVDVSNVCRIVSANPVKGMYDYLDSSRPVRSGRFKGDAATAAKIVQWTMTGSVARAYRILNSGDAVITVRTLKTTDGGKPPTAVLQPRMSIDVATSGDITVEGTGIECIYELITEDQEGHSGRFNIKVANQPPHKIIDLTDGGSSSWYRIYNSGAGAFDVYREGATAAQKVTVRKGRSFDFRVNNSVPILVESADKISGIYEYLGQ